MAVKVDTQKEIIFGSSNPNISRVISKKEKDGELRKLAPRIYTTNLIDSPANIVRRNLIEILVYRYPNALISHRSAKEMRPTSTGDFFLTNSTTRRVTDLPGIIYRLWVCTYRENTVICSKICSCLENQEMSRGCCLFP